MKRSEINALISEAIGFLDDMNYRLPRWAYWDLGEWRRESRRVEDIAALGLGWDLTDFGENDFRNKGLILFTIRNGDLSKQVNQKCYAEKVMILGEHQVVPLHFHYNKTEDIINRGGGDLVVEVCASDGDEQLSDRPVSIKVDEVSRMVEPMEKIVLASGESICLEPFIYHRFYGEAVRGRMLLGEVSSVNDDVSDNRFYEPIGRFPVIEEDEAPFHLLVIDYANYL